MDFNLYELDDDIIYKYENRAFIYWNMHDIRDREVLLKGVKVSDELIEDLVVVEFANLPSEVQIKCVKFFIQKQINEIKKLSNSKFTK